MADEEIKITDDVNNDGVVNNYDLEMSKLKYGEERSSRLQYHQRLMAWTALGSMLIFTIFLFIPFVPDARIALLSEVSSLFYIAQAGIVGAFMGAAAIMNTKK